MLGIFTVQNTANNQTEEYML